MLKEFREFAMKGNVVDLAIGVIIGAAFGKIIDALVSDIIMPVIGIAGKADFSNYFVPLSTAVNASNLADARKQGGVLAYGDFVTIVINFLIIAFALFFVVKGLNSMKKSTPAVVEVPPTSEETLLLMQIRDLLAQQRAVGVATLPSA